MITMEQGSVALENIVKAMAAGDWNRADRLARGLDEAAAQGEDHSYGAAYGIYRERASR